MGGGGGGTEVRLSTGALEAMWREDGLRPVLQLATAPRMVADSARAERYRVALSDGGARLELAELAASLNHLVARGALRRGTLVRVLEYFAGFNGYKRVLIVIQLEMLQAECKLISNLTMYEVNAQHIGVSCSDGLTSHEPCFTPRAQRVVSNSSCSPGQGLLDSSVTPRAESTVNNLPFSEHFCSMPAQSTLDTKMKQLSLNDHQNQRFKVTATGDSFGPPANSYGSPMPPSYIHSTPMYIDRSHVAQSESPLCITPVSQLNLYQTRWKIKGRVTAKTDLKHFTNAKGPGKFFTFDLLDAQGGEACAVCFNLQADKFFDLIEVGKVYLISRGSLEPAQKKSKPFNNDFEILVDHTTSVEICCDDENSFPRQQYNFRQISEVENMDTGAFVDLVGIVTSVSPSAIMIRKDGTEAQKKTLQLKGLVSAGGHQPELTPPMDSPQQTPHSVSSDPLQRRSVDQSSKRFTRDYSVNSPRKKASYTASIEDALEELNTVIKTAKKRQVVGDELYNEELAQVRQILRADGYKEHELHFVQALNLCRDKHRRRAFLEMESKEGRDAWVKVSWQFAMEKSK